MNNSHFVIWALPRVGSTTLSDALGAVSEPFKHHDDWTFVTPAEIEKFCRTRRSLKHLYGEGPEENNFALARAANRNGYRHIHLVRCDEFARLVSYDIAAQETAWLPEYAGPKFDKLKRSTRQLHPLDIDGLLELHRVGIDRWRELSQRVGTFLTVRFEDITTADWQRRHAALRRLALYLGLSSNWMRRLDRAMETGGQNTQSVWDHVPNLGEFRRALITEGVL